MNDLELFPPSKNGEKVSAEGGDIMMFDKDHLMIGSSERTTPYAFHSLKNYLLANDIVANVAQINIPNERSFMHIDTLFTRVNHDLMACFKPIVYDGEGSNVIVYRQDGTEHIYPSIKEYVISEIRPDMKFVFSGGGDSPAQEREQWTDSVNLVAIKPGVAISYDRNLRTLTAFEKEGYQVITAQELRQRTIQDNQYIQTLEKAIITIPSAELSRARGGSHCMTCPMVREELTT